LKKRAFICSRGGGNGGLTKKEKVVSSTIRESAVLVGGRKRAVPTAFRLSRKGRWREKKKCVKKRKDFDSDSSHS